MPELTVLVVGASGDLGELTAKALAAAGHRVFAAMRDVRGRNAEPARNLAKWRAPDGQGLEVIEIDVANEGSVSSGVADVLTRAGQIDVLINFSGVAAGGPLEAFSPELMQSIFEVNVFGPVRVDRAVLPSMRARKAGLIIHVTSTLGHIAVPMSGPYSASKAAMEKIAESMFYELRPLGIDSIVFCPGQYPTGAISKRQTADRSEVAAAYAGVGQRNPPPDLEPSDPQEVADTIASLVAMPAGTRPKRTIVGRQYAAGVRELNEAYERSRTLFWASVGVSEPE